MQRLDYLGKGQPPAYTPQEIFATSSRRVSDDMYPLVVRTPQALTRDTPQPSPSTSRPSRGAKIRSRLSKMPSMLPSILAKFVNKLFILRKNNRTTDVEQGGSIGPPPTGMPPTVNTNNEDPCNSTRHSLIDLAYDGCFVCIGVILCAAIIVLLGVISVLVGQRLLLHYRGDAWETPSVWAARVGAVGSTMICPIVFGMMFHEIGRWLIVPMSFALYTIAGAAGVAVLKQIADPDAGLLSIGQGAAAGIVGWCMVCVICVCALGGGVLIIA
ncbi:hypothetical protein BD626DRAFT_634040 [Schizophyllum amplum]|uniref:Yip1 domain-containing protein n=1 Tax=Schizophyllum amplum TaxID=97359 RepID=A0A550C1A1_9AGAR|nr:hypothetical protein BD626DRAFT_634040 [Auriculariopsis ampla]